MWIEPTLCMLQTLCSFVFFNSPALPQLFAFTQTFRFAGGGEPNRPALCSFYPLSPEKGNTWPKTPTQTTCPIFNTCCFLSGKGSIIKLSNILAASFGFFKKMLEITKKRRDDIEIEMSWISSCKIMSRISRSHFAPWWKCVRVQRLTLSLSLELGRQGGEKVGREGMAGVYRFPLK